MRVRVGGDVRSFARALADERRSMMARRSKTEPEPDGTYPDSGEDKNSDGRLGVLCGESRNRDAKNQGEADRDEHQREEDLSCARRA